MYSTQTADDINTISTFISSADVSDLTVTSPIDCLVVCVSSVLHSATTVLRAIHSRPSLAKTIVFCGGIGHSTSHIYDAIARHPTYHTLASQVRGLPEAQVLKLIYDRFYLPHTPASDGQNQQPWILVEDKSTNCGANAVETRRVLDAHGITEPVTVVIVQDPTMTRRMVAGFERVYADKAQMPRFLGCPVFVPLVECTGDGELKYQVETGALEGVWEMKRFLGLVMGEIPRLMDDEEGYGPRGKGFIAHVDVPDEVEGAWRRLMGVLEHSR